MLFGITANAQLTYNPAPSSGIINLTSSSTNISVTNTSSTSVVNTNFSVASNSAGIFISINRCAVINPRQTCQVTISFTNYGKSTSAIAVDFKNGSTVIASLTYNPLNPPPQVSNFSVSSLTMNDFNSYTFSITNKTLSTKSYAPVFGGTNPTKYSITLNRCSNIVPNASCQVTIKLLPQQAGSFSAIVSEPQVTGTINLSSTITNATAGVLPATVYSLTASPSSIDFGTISRIGSTTAQNVTITNNGNIAISPIISISGDGLQISTNRCLILLGVGQSCTVSMIFNANTGMTNGAQSGLSLSAKAQSSSTPVIVSFAANLNIVPTLLVTNPLVAGAKVSAIGAGSYHSCAIDEYNLPRCWGWNAYGQAQPNLTTVGPLVGKTVKMLSAGGWKTCFIADDNLGYCAGYNTSGALGAGHNSNGGPYAVDTSGALSGKTLKFISAGYDHTCAIASDNLGYCWGDNQFGQLGKGNSGSGTNSNVPVAVVMSGALSGKTLKFIAAGFHTTCAIASDNLPYCWGGNTFGELGNNTLTPSSVPVAVSMSGALAGKTAKFMALGNANNTYHSCLIASDNLPYCWGRNIDGSLGNNSSTSSQIPVAVDVSGALSGKTAKSIFVGTDRSCILANDNLGYCWGANAYGQLGDGTSISSPVPIAMSRTGVLAGRTATALTAGFHHGCLLADDQNAYCWGFNSFGQLGDGTTSDSINPLQVTQY